MRAEGENYLDEEGGSEKGLRRRAEKRENKDTRTFLTPRNKSLERERKTRHKPNAHIEVCFLQVCVCLWIHSLPQSSNERGELPASPSPQSLVRPSCSPPALLSLFITIWTTVCRLLSLSLSPCCSFFFFFTSSRSSIMSSFSCCDQFPALSVV